MKRRMTIFLTICLLAGLALWSAGRGVKAKTTLAVAAIAIESPVPAAINVPAGGPSAAAQAASGCATPSFAVATSFGAGDGPSSVTTGDFNADGRLDLATANEFSDNISILLGRAGGFAAATNFGAGGGPQSVTTGDFNADGKLDLATANIFSNNVSILLGDGLGGFAAATNFGAGDAPRSVTTGDFNADGKLDLATANDFSNNVSILLGNGMGGFAAAANFGAGSSPASVTTGDFNSDGKLDLATANIFSDNVSALLNTCTTNTAPVAQCKNVTVAAGASCTAYASIDNGSYDPDSGDTITVAQSPAGPYPLGATTVTLTVTDARGASSSCSAIVTVVDNTPPAITASARKADNTPYTAGAWTNQSVTVHFTCSDLCSGISSCPADVTLSSSGVTALVSGIAIDGAGNTASTGFGPVQIDKTPPAVSVTGVAHGATYPLGAVPAAACNTTDAHSGVATAATLNVTGGNAHGVGTFTATCGSATDNVGNTSAPVSVSYTVAYNLNKFVALAQEGVELDQRSSVVSGDVGARIASSGPFLGNGVEVSIGQQVDMLNPASRLLGDSLFIRQGATVYNPSYNDLTNNGSILGTSVTPLNLALIPALPALPAISPGTQNIEVEQQGALTLNAGGYGDLTVRQRATITFTGGVYHFQSWNVGQLVNLHFLAPTEIRIAGKLGVDQRSYLGPAPSATGLTAKDIVIYVAGQNGNSGALGGDPKAAVFGQITTLKANVVVPFGTLLLRQRTEATGAFFGKWVQAGQQVKLTLESRFGL